MFFPAIRKLTTKRRCVEGKLERRNIIHDYAEYGSQTYAPMTRIGVFLDRGSEQFAVKSHYTSTYHGSSRVRELPARFCSESPHNCTQTENCDKEWICEA